MKKLIWDGFIALAIGILAGTGFLLFKDHIPFANSGRTLCKEDPVEPISTGFTAPDTSGTVPVFENLFSISNQGVNRGYIDSSGESDVWVAGGKLAYIVTYFKDTNVIEDVVYYDGKEVDRSVLYPFFPLQKIADRLSYYGKTKIVFGDTTFPFPQLNSVSLEDTQAIDGKLFIRGYGGAYYDGEKVDEEKNYIFAINGSMAKSKVENLGTTTIAYQGESIETQKKKTTFVYRGKEYGTEFDGFTGGNVALCNGKPVYAVQEGSFILDKNYQQYLIYKGKVIAGPYPSIRTVQVIGGDIVFLAAKGERTILVKNGTEISEPFDTVNGFFSHNGHLVYLGVDTETTETSERTINGLGIRTSGTLFTYYLMEDGQLLYKTKPNEQITFGFGLDRKEVIPVGDKLAILVRDNSTNQTKVLYDGKEVLQEYAGAVGKIFNLNGKLGALVADRNDTALTSSIVLEGSKTKPAPPKTPEPAPKRSPVQDKFDILSKGTPLEGQVLTTSDNDYLDGGPGQDTVQYSGQRAAYELYRGKDAPPLNAYNTFFAVDKRNGSIDTLVNIERIDFADQLIALPDMTVLSTKQVPVASSTAAVHFRERAAIQNQAGRTVSIMPLYLSSTAVSFSVLFESATQKLLSIPVGGSDIIVLTDDINGPRLTVSVVSAQDGVVTLDLAMSE